MKLEKMTFVETEEGAVPDEVTVTLTIREAAFLTRLTGRLNDLEANEVLPGGDEELRSIYETLTGSVFNPYWDDGVDGWRATAD